MNHYVYMLESNDDGRFYVGVRSCKCNPEEDTKYKSSSKVVTKEYLDGCSKTILGTFESRAEAVSCEIYMHEVYDVGRNKRFFNKAKQTSTGFDTSGRQMSREEIERRTSAQYTRYKNSASPLKGRKQSKEHAEKAAKARVGTKRSKETKNKISKKVSGSNNGAFKPWWYKYEGAYIEVYNKSVSEVAKELGVELHVLKDRFRSEYKGKEKKNAPLKGIVVGRINSEK